jgi:hypothetical protein
MNVSFDKQYYQMIKYNAKGGKYMSDTKNDNIEIKIPKKQAEELQKNLAANGCGCGCILGCQVKVDP